MLLRCVRNIFLKDKLDVIFNINLQGPRINIKDYRMYYRILAMAANNNCTLKLNKILVR